MLMLRLLSAALLPLLACATAAEGPGTVMYLGDSITHGINTGSWRWDYHKILADNGISYTETGYNRDNFQRGRGNGVDLAGDSYGGIPFLNVHSAQEGGCSWQYLNGGAPDYTQSFADGSTMHLSTRSGAKYGGHRLSELAAAYDPDTYYVLIGINDIQQSFRAANRLLSGVAFDRAVRSILGAVAEAQGYRFCGDGTMDGLLAAARSHRPDAATVILGLVPTAANANTVEEHNALARFNSVYRRWAEHRGLRFVDLSPGTVDVSRFSDDATRNDTYGALTTIGQRVDWIHPGPQTNLIMAGNLAAAMGYGGRTAGLPRRAATAENSFTRLPLSGTEQPLPSNLSLDIAAPRAGNGQQGGWDAQAVVIRFGDAQRSGTILLNESSIMWGTKDRVLYSCDMSRNTRNLRVAWVEGDEASAIRRGYYVWLGEQLIGEALPPEGPEPGLSVQIPAGLLFSTDGIFCADRAWAPASEEK